MVEQCVNDADCWIFDRCRQGCELYADCVGSEGCESVHKACQETLDQCRQGFLETCLAACPDGAQYCTYPTCEALISEEAADLCMNQDD